MFLSGCNFINIINKYPFKGMCNSNADFIIPAFWSYFFLLFINDILLRSYPMILLVPSKIVSGLAVPFPIVKQGVPAIVVSS